MTQGPVPRERAHQSESKQSRRPGGLIALALFLVGLPLLSAWLFPDLKVGWVDLPARAQAETSAAKPEAKSDAKRVPQTRPSRTRVAVPVDRIRVDDGDTVDIEWPDGDRETVRILGIDTPEIRHPDHNLPYDQSFGREALAFGRGAFLTADRVELLRADMIDPYGRSLGYLFVNGRNYSELVVSAGLAVESVSFYGDNGFPDEAKRVLEAAASAGPVPFEPPHEFRTRMRKLTDYMKATGKSE